MKRELELFQKNIVLTLKDGFYALKTCKKRLTQVGRYYIIRNCDIKSKCSSKAPERSISLINTSHIYHI